MIFLINYPNKIRLFSSLKTSLTNEFLDSLSFHLFLPHIFQPTRVTGNSKTLTENIFSNAISPTIITDNLTSSISDHLPQFLIVPNIFSTPQPQNLTHKKKTGLNLTKNTLPLTTFKLIGIRHYVKIVMTLINPFKSCLINLTHPQNLYAPYKNLK